LKITIVYDNEVKQPELKADWGFSSLIETQDAPPILFDTGADGSILLHNMSQLKIDPSSIGIVVISHPHWDHSGGLEDLLKVNKDAELCLPQSFPTEGISGRKITLIKEPLQIRKNIFSTGELDGIEQSLVVNTDKGLLVLVGCSHPGVGNILDAASRFGQVYGIIGGFHGFDDFKRLEGLPFICPCHCTAHKAEVKRLFAAQCMDCSAGVVIEL
jgi:7,8-dihydropterin-6-yl-methyl-4-(beta-D-ribofuranosyl)aminobenzene 5'-phosphate synthase